jgi:hypothetical protein
VKEIAEMGTPDSNGNTLPLSVTQGRVSFSAASGNPTDPMNVVIGGGIYNPAKAVCGNTCECCDGCTSFQITPNPANATVGVLTQLYAQCPWTTGGLYDYTESSSWSSGNTSIVVFDSPGLANPLSPGSTTADAQIPSLPVSMGQICTQGNDADDMLNVPVAKLDLGDISPSNTLSNPVRYIPAVRAALHKGATCENRTWSQRHGPGNGSYGARYQPAWRPQSCISGVRRGSREASWICVGLGVSA